MDLLATQALASPQSDSSTPPATPGQRMHEERHSARDSDHHRPPHRLARTSYPLAHGSASPLSEMPSMRRLGGVRGAPLPDYFPHRFRAEPHSPRREEAVHWDPRRHGQPHNHQYTVGTPERSHYDPQPILRPLSSNPLRVSAALASSGSIENGLRPKSSTPFRDPADVVYKTEDRPARVRGRAAPYLTETDRQDIMERIRRGEKQADLAKEYNVSRAAITNLKQRRQMLEMLEQNQRNMQLAQLGASNSNTNHSGRDKRRKLSTEGRHVESENGDKDPGRDIEAGDSDGVHSTDSTSVKIEPRLPVPLPQRVHHRQVSPPTISRVLSTLLDASTADDVFQATAQRFIRLVLEETIGRSFAHAQNQAQTTPFAPCVITCGSKEAAAMGKEFQLLEPSAFVASSATIDQQDDPEGVVVSVRLPREALERRPVMLFFDDIDVAGGAVNEQHSDSHRGDDPIHRCLLYVLSLVFQGVPENLIFVVLCLCDAALAEQLQQRFPKVHVVTARFLSSTETVEDLHRYRVRLRAMIDEQSKQR